MASGWLESLKPLIEKLVREAIQQEFKDLLPGHAGCEPRGDDRTVLLKGSPEQTARRKGKGVAQGRIALREPDSSAAGQATAPIG